MYWNFDPHNLPQDWYASVNQENFEQLAVQIFHYQVKENPLYQAFCSLVKPNYAQIQHIDEIPFLPIHFFKTHQVTTSNFEPQVIFESSGTTQTTQSKHLVKSASLYLNTCLGGFEQFFGPIQGTPILCLLPSYLERNNSSLVYMAQHLIEKSMHTESNFYLYDVAKLAATIQALETKQEKYILLGVTFALLDFAEAYPMPLKYASIMETGGMKGRKEEWTRKQVHQYLKKQWGLHQVYAEYGMTELLSQAYCIEDELFKPINTLCAYIRDINDPLSNAATGKGALNIIDLSNIHSCSFIATEDLGQMYADGSFEVLGRMDQSALRGCSLMAL